MDINSYIIQECIAVVPVLYIFGAMLKKCKKFPDEWIPFAVSGLGIVISTILIIVQAAPVGPAAWADAIVTGLMQGILCAGASVLTNQIHKQSEKMNTSPEDYMIIENEEEDGEGEEK